MNITQMIKMTSGATKRIALVLAVGAGVARAQDLARNGDLENAVFAPNPGESVEAEVSGITGWSLSSPGPFVYYINGQWIGPSSTTGHWLLLQGTMTQTINNLPAGEYTFNFDWFRRRPNVDGGGEEMAYLVTGPGGLSVTGNTTSNQTEGEWHHVTQTIILAAAGDVTLSFAVSGNDWGIGIDNIAFAGPGSDSDKVVNGNLETSAGLAPNDGDTASARIPGGITDWSLSGSRTYYVNGQWVGPDSTTGHWLLLGGNLSQTLTAVPAGTYTFSFDWFRRRADVEGNGEELTYLVTGPGGDLATGDTTGNQTPSEWHTVTQTVTLATAGDITLSFTVSGNDWGIGLDKIAWVYVPPRGTVIMLW